MGAANFVTMTGCTDSLEDAFEKAVEDAQYMHGHAGYTGTLAEKGSVVEVPLGEVPDGMDVKEYAWQLLEENDERITDKWGPAGAIKVPSGGWVFFGRASS